MVRTKSFIVYSLVFIAGVVLGGYLFHASLPRSFLAFSNCHSTCLKEKDLLGLMGSVGIKNIPGKIPGIIKETDKTVVIKHPFPEAKTHLVIIPKKDIRDIASVSDEDKAYITDAMAVIGDIIREKNLKSYKIVTYGPTYQHVTYLHFHLISDD